MNFWQPSPAPRGEHGHEEEPQGPVYLCRCTESRATATPSETSCMRLPATADIVTLLRGGCRDPTLHPATRGGLGLAPLPRESCRTITMTMTTKRKRKRKRRSYLGEICGCNTHWPSQTRPRWPHTEPDHVPKNSPLDLSVPILATNFGPIW